MNSGTQKATEEPENNNNQATTFEHKCSTDTGSAYNAIHNSALMVDMWHYTSSASGRAQSKAEQEVLKTENQLKTQTGKIEDAK